MGVLATLYPVFVISNMVYADDYESLADAEDDKSFPNSDQDLKPRFHASDYVDGPDGLGMGHILFVGMCNRPSMCVYAPKKPIKKRTRAHSGRRRLVTNNSSHRASPPKQEGAPHCTARNKNSIAGGHRCQEAAMLQGQSTPAGGGGREGSTPAGGGGREGSTPAGGGGREGSPRTEAPVILVEGGGQRTAGETMDETLRVVQREVDTGMARVLAASSRSASSAPSSRPRRCLSSPSSIARGVARRILGKSRSSPAAFSPSRRTSSDVAVTSGSALEAPATGALVILVEGRVVQREVDAGMARVLAAASSRSASSAPSSRPRRCLSSPSSIARGVARRILGKSRSSPAAFAVTSGSALEAPAIPLDMMKDPVISASGYGLFHRARKVSKIAWKKLMDQRKFLSKGPNVARGVGWLVDKVAPFPVAGILVAGAQHISDLNDTFDVAQQIALRFQSSNQKNYPYIVGTPEEAKAFLQKWEAEKRPPTLVEFRYGLTEQEKSNITQVFTEHEAADLFDDWILVY